MPMSPAPIAPSTRVGQRMQPDIGIRMADRGHSRAGSRCRNHDMVARPERVHVEALADADIAEPAREQPLGGGKVLRGGHLQIVLAAGDDERRHAGRLGDRRVVGQDARPQPPGAPPGSARSGKPCGVCARHNCARSTVSRIDAVRDPLDRVAERQRRDRRRARRRARRSPGRSAPRQETAGPRHGSAPAPGLAHQRLQPEPHQFLPLGAARHRRQDRQPGDRAYRIRARSSSRITTCTPSIRGCVANAATAWRSTVPPPSGRYCFGSVAAEPGAAAGGDDYGVGPSHRANLSANRGSRSAPERRAMWTSPSCTCAPCCGAAKFGVKYLPNFYAYHANLVIS